MLQSSRMTAGMTYSRSDAEDKAVYKAMECAVKAKKIRSIGISNYYTEKTAKRFCRFRNQACRGGILLPVRRARPHRRCLGEQGCLKDSEDSPKNPDHIAENISIFDFELTDDEMKQIASLNTGHRYENW